MKLELFKKQNIFKKKSIQFNLNLFWKIAVCVGLVSFGLALFFGYRLFIQINQEAALPVGSTSGQVPTVDKARFDKVLNYFSDREKKSSDILNSPAPVVDPSH